MYRQYSIKQAGVKTSKTLSIREEFEKREESFISPYGMLSSCSRGREKDEEPCPVRTVYQQDRAALDLCAIERGRALAISTDKTIESDKWRKIARMRFWMLVGAGVVIGVYLSVRKKLGNYIAIHP